MVAVGGMVGKATDPDADTNGTLSAILGGARVFCRQDDLILPVRLPALRAAAHSSKVCLCATRRGSQKLLIEWSYFP